MLTLSNHLVAIIVVLALVAAGALLFGLVQSARIAAARRGAAGSRAARGMERIWQMLATVPEGLFFWDADSGAPFCSTRAAAMLGLAPGSNTTFAQLAAAFDERSRIDLEGRTRALRETGEEFITVLTTARGGRSVQVVGARAATAEGAVAADALWLRETGTAAVREVVDDRDRLMEVLDALPVAMWLRDDNLDVTFTNRACSQEAVAPRAKELARRARQEGRALEERHPLPGGRDGATVRILETPLPAWLSGTLGVAIDYPDVERDYPVQAARPAAAPAAAPSVAPAVGIEAGLVAVRDVLDTLRSAVALYDGRQRLRFANAAFARLWGVERSWLDTHPDMGHVLDKLRELRKLPEVANFRAFKEEQLDQFGNLEAAIETLMHLPDGSSLRAIVGPYAEGGLVCVYEDVSENLGLERSYHAAEAVQRATLDQLQEGVVVFGSDGRVRLSNPRFAEIWRFPPGALAGEMHAAGFVEQVRKLAAGLSELDAETWKAQKERILARMMGRESMEGQMMFTDGTALRYVHVPLPDGASMLSYLDVTDGIRVEKALRDRANAFEEADRLKSAFIANVSHELRTPLTTISGFGQILAEGLFGRLTGRQMDYARGIVDTSRDMQNLLADVLDLASIEAGTASLDLDTVDVNGLLLDVINLVRPAIARGRLKSQFDCPADIGWLVADPRRVKQVVFNLMTNAVKFTPPGGTIVLSARREGDEVAITVTDNGGGIPRAELARVFSDFQRGAPAQAATSGLGGGAGLGLSLVKRFVEMHGGRIEIDSAPGRGTRVTCRFPVTQA